MRHLPQRLTCIAAALGVAATVSIASAPAAQAMGCNVAHRYVSGQIASPTYADSPLRNGPGEQCGIKGRVVRYTPGMGLAPFFKDCWIRNDAGNIWWYGSIQTQNGMQDGWMFAGNMTAGYSGVEARYRCF